MGDVERCRASWQAVPVAMCRDDIEDIGSCFCREPAGHDGYHICVCGGQVWPVGTLEPAGDWYLRHVKADG